MNHADRRQFLKVTAAAAALAGTSRFAAAAPIGGKERKTKRVILIAFAGGVRSKETFGSDMNVPTL